MNKPIEKVLVSDKPMTLAAAFVRAQKGFAPALKSSSNPQFKSKYADLAACVEAVIDALNDNGIALLQHTHEASDGVIVETVFLHESGETLSSGKLHVPATKHDAQGYGSALTYARRYSLMAACGIAPEDDDGNAASKAKPKAEPKPEPEATEQEIQDAINQLTVAAESGKKSLAEAVSAIPDRIKSRIDPKIKQAIAAKAGAVK